MEDHDWSLVWARKVSVEMHLLLSGFGVVGLDGLDGLEEFPQFGVWPDWHDWKAVVSWEENSASHFSSVVSKVFLHSACIEESGQELRQPVSVLYASRRQLMVET